MWPSAVRILPEECPTSALWRSRPEQLLPSRGRNCTRGGSLHRLEPLSRFKPLLGFGPPSAHARGEAKHVDPIDHYPGVVPSGWRGLGIFPLARVALARPLTCPDVSRWNIRLIRRGPTLECIVGSVRRTLRSGRRINRGMKLARYTRSGSQPLSV